MIDSFCEQKRSCRAAERKWRKTGLEVLHIVIFTQMSLQQLSHNIQVQGRHHYHWIISITNDETQYRQEMNWAVH